MPTRLVHGNADDRVPLGQSEAYAAAASAAGDDCELHTLPGADHFELTDPGGRAFALLAPRIAALAGTR